MPRLARHGRVWRSFASSNRLFCLREKTESIVQNHFEYIYFFAFSPTSHVREISRDFPIPSWRPNLSNIHSCDAAAAALTVLAAVRARGVSRLDGDPDGDDRECDCDW